MSTLNHRDVLTPDEIDSKIQKFDTKEWDYLRNHICLKTDRIILPGFPTGIRWRSEIGQYGLETARQNFSKKLMRHSQVQDFLEHLAIFDTYFSGIHQKILSVLLQMDSEKNTPYLVEGDKTLKNMLGWKKPQAHELFIDQGKVSYQLEGIDIPTISTKPAKKAFKIRLVAD